MASWPDVLAAVESRRLDTRARGEWPCLRGGDWRRAGDDVAGRDAERDLGGDEPGPGDPGVQRGIDDSEGGPEQSAPQEGCEQAAPEEKAPRKQRQDGRVQR